MTKQPPITFEQFRTMFVAMTNEESPGSITETDGRLQMAIKVEIDEMLRQRYHDYLVRTKDVE